MTNIQTSHCEAPLVAIAAENDAIDRGILAATLSDDGCRVFQAENSNAAISRININGVDVLLMNIDMPGWESLVLHTLNKSPDAFVMASAGKDSVTDTSDLKRHGIHLFLQKPLSYEFVRRSLRDMRLSLSESHKIDHRDRRLSVNAKDSLTLLHRSDRNP